jgi:hypothetical protein
MSIEGKGDIASVLSDREDFTYFASGVSNSQEVRESEYQREKELLMNQDRSKRLVYFGSLSIFYSDNRYSKHKREMEELIVENFPKYCIIRIGNITWGKNPHTLINTLRNKVANQEPVEIHDVYRYVVDEEEFLYWVSLIPDFNCEINIPGERMKVKEIFNKYV